MESAPQGREGGEDILVKMVQWYKSTFRVQTESEDIYEIDIDPLTRKPRKDQNNRVLYKKDQYGNLLHKIDPITKKKQQRPNPSKVFENKIAGTGKWLGFKLGDTYNKANKSQKEKFKKEDPKWVKEEDLPPFHFVNSLSENNKSERDLKKKALEIYEENGQIKNWVKFEKNDCLKIEFFFNRYMD